MPFESVEIPPSDSTRQIERAAANLVDPVARLRYLRRELNKSRTPHTRTLPAVAGAVVVCSLVFLALATPPNRAQSKPQTTATASKAATEQNPRTIWLVEQQGSSMAYSNGLQIRTDYLTDSRPRKYPTYSRQTFERTSADQTKPAGIVFHTTESLLLPLDPDGNRNLIQTREDLLKHIRGGRLYNYLIDRFGQVFRIIPDDQIAFHAGHSVWADDQLVYEGLNESFLGVAFEARSESETDISEAQLRAGRLLTSLLRVTWGISDADCVTHAQISVNPDNMRLGYHTDWGGHFPFEAIGVANGYRLSVAAVELFGFQYDGIFLKAIGGSPWPGLIESETRIQRAAEAKGLPIANFRQILQQHYRTIRSKKTYHEQPDRDRT